MSFFHPKSDDFQKRHAQTYARYEIAYTFVDFFAAGLFVVGSVLFFSESTATIATWLFLIGSIFFGLKPTLRMIREIHLYRVGDYKTLNHEFESE